jgi:hypothetical protein
MLTPRLQRCLQPGLSIVVGAADAQGMPTCCRAFALRSQDELKSVTVYVPIATSHETIQALATTGRLAITATHPAEHSATQLKGVTTETRLAREDEAAFVRERVGAFVEILDGYGVPRRVSNRATSWPAFAITMRVEEIFEQTPGPNAGSRLR